MIRLLAAASIAACTLSTPSLADGWSFSALEDGLDQESCMTRARAVLDIYERRFGRAADITEGSWSIAGYDIGAGVNTSFICRTEGGSDPTWLITHSVDMGDDDRSTIHDRLRDIWNSPK